MNIQLWLRWGKEKLTSINLGRLKIFCSPNYTFSIAGMWGWQF